jgi:CheY-like chemotaxis protein
MKIPRSGMAHKILVIDDDKGTVEVIKNILVGQNYQVVIAYDGKEGLEQVRSKKPDLIVLDVRMPSMNGYEFVRTLRAETSSAGKIMVPVIVLTAKEKMEEVFRLEGAKGYLVKPVDPIKLTQKIEECLNKND